MYRSILEHWLIINTFGEIVKSALVTIICLAQLHHLPETDGWWVNQVGRQVVGTHWAARKLKVWAGNWDSNRWASERILPPLCCGAQLKSLKSLKKIWRGSRKKLVQHLVAGTWWILPSLCFEVSVEDLEPYLTGGSVPFSSNDIWP